MTIQANSFIALCRAIEDKGYRLSDLVRQPMRVRGFWICEVAA